MSDTNAIEDVPAVEPIVEEPIEDVEAIVEEILGEPEEPTEQTGPPADNPPVEEPPVEGPAADVPAADHPAVEEPDADAPAAAETTADDADVAVEELEAPQNDPKASTSELEVSAEDPAAPVTDLTAKPVNSQPEEITPATGPSSSQVAVTMAAHEPEAATLLETEQAIECAIAAPEAPTSQTIPEPGQYVSTPDVPTGPAAHLKQGAKGSHDKAKAKVDDAIAAAIPGPTPPPKHTDPTAPGAPSVM
jgi:hypothetical protein